MCPLQLKQTGSDTAIALLYSPGPGRFITLCLMEMSEVAFEQQLRAPPSAHAHATGCVTTRLLSRLWHTMLVAALPSPSINNPRQCGNRDHPPWKQHGIEPSFISRLKIASISETALRCPVSFLQCRKVHRERINTTASEWVTIKAHLQTLFGNKVWAAHPQMERNSLWTDTEREMGFLLLEFRMTFIETFIFTIIHISWIIQSILSLTAFVAHLTSVMWQV